MKVLIAIIGWAKGATNGDHQVMRDTWLRDTLKHPDLEYKYFIGDGTPMTEDETELHKSLDRGIKCCHPSLNKIQTQIEFTPKQDEILVHTPDDYGHVTAKSREALRWAVARGFDYIFTCYPDTFVNVDRLMSSGFAGHDYVGLSIGYAKGGQGRWLSRKAAALAMNEPVTDWAEDRWIGDILARKGIPLHDDRRYVDYPLAPAPGNNYITSHLAETPIPYDQNLTRRLYQQGITSDVVISVTRGYGWDELKCYANSLSRCGFRGIKLFFVENITAEARRNLLALGFTLVDYHSAGSFWYMRHRVTADWLQKHLALLRYVVWADCRDLVFQTDPSTWLEKNLAPSRIIGLNENWLIKEEWLNDQWVKEIASPEEYARVREGEVYNGGTIAGEAVAIQAFFKTVSDRLIGSDRVDQGLINLVLRQSPFKEVFRAPRMREGFAVAFSSIVRDPNHPSSGATDELPTFDTQAGVVYAPNTTTPLVMLHQYDRHSSWKGIIERKYSGNLNIPTSQPPRVVPPRKKGGYAADGLTLDWFDTHPRG